MRTLAIALLVLTLAGCGDSGKGSPTMIPGAPPPGAAGAAKPAAAGDEALATVGAKTISRAAAEEMVKTELAELDAQRYELLRGSVDELVAQALVEQEAAERHVSVGELQTIEIFSKVEPPSDADVQKYYDENRDRFFGRPLEGAKDEIAKFLQRANARARVESFLAELKKKFPTTIALRPPTVEVAVGNAPTKGPANAPVTIIEFSDYETPFSKSTEPNLQYVLRLYGDKVRLAFRNYPPPGQANAGRAAEAALCAKEQGKFWPYHDTLMAASDLSAANLQQLASDSGLDRAQFDQCLATKKFKDAVQEDIDAGAAAGVDGTPAFFINGRLLTGPQSAEQFQEVIDEELEFAGQG